MIEVNRKTMKKTIIARDLEDAISLAFAWLSELDLNSIVEYADIHMNEIAHFSPGHPLIREIGRLKREAIYLRQGIKLLATREGYHSYFGGK